MDKIIAANWKMNNSFSDIKPFVKYVKKNQKNKNNLVVCVPSVMLNEFAKQAKGHTKQRAARVILPLFIQQITDTSL